VLQGRWQAVRSGGNGDGATRVSFKCSPENFAELCERPGIIPAPYMARAQWVSLERLNALPDSELREMISESYRLVWERLPMKRRVELGSGAAAGARRPAVRKPKTESRKASVKAKSSVKTKSAKAGRRG
jgi:predicted DNA-binding protein (MmcQ/YjbR family)